MDNAKNIGLIVIGVTALVVLANGLTTLFNNWWSNKNKLNYDHIYEYKEFKMETNTLLKNLEGTLHNLDKTITKLDLTLDNVTKDQLAMRKDIDDMQDDITNIKQTIYSKHYVK